MAKTQISVRFDRETLHRVDAYAEELGTTRTEILERAAVAMLERDSSQGSEPDTETLRAHLEDVRSMVSILERQLDAKDQQITALHDQLSALATITDHAQALQAAAEVRALPVEAEEEQAEEQAEDGERRGPWEWIRGIFKSLGASN